MFKKIAIGIGILIVILVIFNLINQISSTLNVSTRLKEAADDVLRARIRNQELKDKLSEIKSLHSVEEIARNKLGLVKDGETIVIIPDEKIKEILGANKVSDEPKLPNYLGWLKLFWP